MIRDHWERGLCLAVDTKMADDDGSPTNECRNYPSLLAPLLLNLVKAFSKTRHTRSEQNASDVSTDALPWCRGSCSWLKMEVQISKLC